MADGFAGPFFRYYRGLTTGGQIVTDVKNYLLLEIVLKCYFINKQF